MVKILALVAAFGLAAGAAQAQIKPLPGVKPFPAFPAFGARPAPAFKPYQPPKLPSVYDGGMFSPEAEASRERRRAAMPPPTFSPQAEARRERQEARRFHPF